MPDLIGVRFRNCGRIYDFDANGIQIKQGDRVIVESEFGLSIGNAVHAPHPGQAPAKELKKVLRVADADDLKRKKDNEAFEKEARSFCMEKILSRAVPMKLVCSEVTLDRKRIVFYFTADGRVDFRELVKDLAAKFKTRIEMRQIGVRDKAKLVGGLGICGKELCCRQFLTSFEPISIKMAKQQDLTLNTGKLSGICGRLMCCLGYEYNMEHAGGAPASEKEPVASEGVGQAEDLPVIETTGEVPCCVPASGIPAAQAEQPGKSAEEGKDPDGKRRRKRRKRFKKKFKKE